MSYLARERQPTALNFASGQVWTAERTLKIQRFVSDRSRMQQVIGQRPIVDQPEKPMITGSKSSPGEQLMPFAVALTLISASSQLSIGQVPFFWLCNALIVLFFIGTGIAGFVRNRRVSATPLSTSVGIFLVSVVVSHVAHPGPGLMQIVMAILGSAVLAHWSASVIRSHGATPLIRTQYGFLLAQIMIGAAQILTDGPVGPSWFSESEFSFRRIGGVLSPSGSLIHTNTLAGFAMVAMVLLVALIARYPMSPIDQRLSAIAVVGGSGLVGLTFCRSAIISLAILLVGCVMVKERRRLVLIAVAGSLLLATSIAVRSDAWTSRAEATVESAESAGSGRMALNRQAIALFKLSPLLGVGPGNYLAMVADNQDIKQLSEENYIAHNVGLYVLATLGVLGVGTFGALCLVVAWKCARRGSAALLIVAAMGPSLALDTALFDYQGLIWLGIGLGVAQGLPKGTPVSKGSPVSKATAAEFTVQSLS
jgi:hypothetical protein